MATSGTEHPTVEFLKHFHPDAPWALTRNLLTGDWSPKMRAVSNVAAYVDECRDDSSLYFNPAIIGNEFDLRRGKPSEADMAGSRAVWAEIDPRDKDRTDWDAVREECLAPLLKFCIAPSLIVYSGRGCWAFWLLDKPALPDEIRAINEWLVVELRKVAGKTVHVDSVANVDRLARLPGSINHRSGRIAEVIGGTRVQHLAQDFGRGGQKPKEVAGGDETIIGAPVPIDSHDDLDQYVDPRLHEQLRYMRLKMLMFHGHDPEDKLKTDSGADASDSGWTFDFAGNAVRAGIPNEVIVGILLDQRHEISKYCLKEKKSERAAVRAVTNAIGKYGAVPGEWLNGLVVADDMVALTEDHLAHVFVDKNSDVRYCAQYGRWYKWDEKRWAADDTLAVWDSCRSITRKAAKYVAEKDYKQAVALSRASTVAAIERMARSDRRVAVRADIFDYDPMILNTPSGVVNLNTGELMSHDRGLYCTKIARVGPEDGEPTAWFEFLNTVTRGDREYIAYIQRVMGYCLTGLTVEHALFFAHGVGGNGKSVLQETLLHILGDYAKTTSFNTLIVQPGGPQHPTDLAGLQGARLVVSPETEANQRWAEAKIKQMTGGDTISARFMRQDYFEYKPQFKLFVVGNHRPSFSNVDEAIRRRVHLLPFDVKIEKPDKRFKEERLYPEAGKILSWAIEGCLQWQQLDGLKAPTKVSEATDGYLTEQDLLGQWLSECTEEAPANAAKIGDLFRCWTDWCDRANERPGSKRVLTNKLRDRGFADANGTGGVRLLTGLQLTDAEQERLLVAARAQKAKAAKDRLIAGMAADDALAQDAEAESAF